VTRDTLPARDNSLFIQPRANDRNEWLSPPDLIAKLGAFDLDPCAPIRRPWPTAARHFTIEDNGLARAWEGRVWLNPPYGKLIVPFMERLAAHGVGTALIFARTDSKWFHELVFSQADALCFMRGRPNFYLPNGSRSTSTGGAPSVLAAYGPYDVDRLYQSGILGWYWNLK